jgi:hypothetical protein
MNMSSLSAIERVRASLEAIAGALLSPNLEGLLAGEQTLASALNALGRIRSVDSPDRAALYVELMRTRTALLRCRTFGSVLDDVTQATLVSQGRGADYDRAGARSNRPDACGGQLKARM